MSDELLEHAKRLYVAGHLTVDELEDAATAALRGDRDRFFVLTHLDPYASFLPVPLPPPEGIGIREWR